MLSFDSLRLRHWVAENWLGVAVVAAVMAIAYSYFATMVLFGDHTMPNTYYFAYPSFRTTSEGRWFADFILLVVGGQGNQAVQSLVSFGILALCGTMLAELFRVRGVAARILIALAFALHPTVIDYFAFSIDQIGFSFGDLLIIAAVLSIDRIPGWRGTALAAGGILLALAIYPPKIALIGVLLITWLVTRALEAETTNDYFRRWFGPAVIATAAGVVLYYATVLVIGVAENSRTAIDSLDGMLQNAINAYPEFARTIVELTEPLPLLGEIGFWLAMVLALVELGRRVIAGRPVLGAIAVILLLLLPLAARASNIVNPATWENSGRVATGYAVLAAALAAWAVMSGRLRLLGMLASAALVYGYAVVATQESAYLALKTTYDVEKISRIVQRIEEYVPYRERRSLVVIGNLEFELNGLFLPNDGAREFRPQNVGDTFAPYRQVELVNFFMGRSAVYAPSEAEAEAAIAASVDRPPWPDPASVFALDESIVVILDPYDPSQSITWTRAELEETYAPAESEEPASTP